MAKTRNILKNLSIENSIGTRKCHANSKHVIKPGEPHLAHEVVPTQRQNICVKCAVKIFDIAGEHLESLRKKLGV